jgi:hypothetical protein
MALLLTFLNGCAGLPLISTLEGSLSINGAVGLATGNYEKQAVSAAINLASHKATGRTLNEHLYAAVETEWTKKGLEKHFPDKKLSITDFHFKKRSITDFKLMSANALRSEPWINNSSSTHSRTAYFSTYTDTNTYTYPPSHISIH